MHAFVFVYDGCVLQYDRCVHVRVFVTGKQGRECMCVRVYVCLCVRLCVQACVRVLHVHACVCVCDCVRV